MPPADDLFADTVPATAHPSDGVAPAHPGEADEDGASLRRLVGTGLQWSVLGTIAARLGGVVSSLIVARLLTPRDFGIYTVGAVALTLMVYANDLGLEPTLVRWPGKVEEVIPTAMTIVALVSGLFFGLIFVGAPWFARTLGAPEGTGVVRVMGVALLISALFTVYSSVVDRLFLQRARTKSELCSVALSIVLTIALALAGFGPYSLALAQVAGNLVVSVGLYRAVPIRCRPGFNRQVARLLARAGLPVCVSGLFAAAALNVDYAVVGHQLGATQLGLYVLAFNLSSWPVTTFTTAVGKVSVAGFGRIQHEPERLHRAFLAALTTSVAVSAPVSALLAGLAGPLILGLYGSKWEASAAPLAVLAALGLGRVVATLVSDMFVAAGWNRAIFVLRGLWLLALCAALPVGARLGGIDGVSVAQLVVAFGVVLPAFGVALHRRGFPLAVAGRSLVRPLAAAAVAFVIAFGLAHAPAPEPLRLLAGGTTGLAAYLVLVRGMWWPHVAPRVAAWRAART